MCAPTGPYVQSALSRDVIGVYRDFRSVVRAGKRVVLNVNRGEIGPLQEVFQSTLFVSPRSNVCKTRFVAGACISVRRKAGETVQGPKVK